MFPYLDQQREIPFKCVSIKSNFLISFIKILQPHLASSRLLTAKVQKPAPNFAGTAVVNSDFKDIKLADFKGKYLVSCYLVT